MLMTVTAVNQTLAAITTAAGGTLESVLGRNDKMRFQIQNLDTSYDLFIDIFTAASVANGSKIVKAGGRFNCSCRPEDLNLIADGGSATNVRIIAEEVNPSN